MKNKVLNGFTLIELLAVILVLAIIMLIAVGGVRKIIDVAKKNGFRVSGEGIVDSAENLYSISNKANEFYYLNGNEYTGGGKYLAYTGKKPETGRIDISDTGEVAIALHNGKYCATKSGDQDQVSVEEKTVAECVTYNIIHTDNSWENIANDYDTPLDFLLDLNEETDKDSETVGRDVRVPIAAPMDNTSIVASEDNTTYYKTYYSLGKTAYSTNFTAATYTYTIDLGVLPLPLSSIKVTRVTATGVYETLDDFRRYILKKQMREVIWPAGESFNLTVADAPSLHNHAATSDNMSVDDVSVTCTAQKCSATITETVTNLDGIDPNIVGVNKEVYLPVRFTVEFNGQNDICSVQKTADTTPGTLLGAGTALSPYVIESVEDLVAISNVVKAGTTYSGKYFSLLNTLDFKSDKSYVNSLTTIYGDLNGNGTVEGLLIELTTGKGFTPIGNSTYAFSGNLMGNNRCVQNLYINTTSNYNGLFGKSSGTITALNMENANVRGAIYTSVVSGYSTNRISDVTVNNANVTGTTYSGLISGYMSSNTVSSVIAQGSVTGTDYVGGLAGFNYVGTLRGILKGGSVTGTGTNVARIVGSTNTATLGNYALNTIKVNGSTISSTSVTSNNGSNINGMSDLNNINVAELSLDTYIGGDDDNNGYYWDIDSDGNLIELTTVEAPLAFNLSGAGTTISPYLISNYNELKQASLKLSSVYKLTTNIDMSGKTFYMIGSHQNPFTGTFNGDLKTITNLTLNAQKSSYIGFSGYNKGTIYSLNLNNVSINGGNCVGGIAGYNTSKVTSSSVNGTVTGINYVALAVGSSYFGTLTSLITDGNIMGTDYVGSIVGYAHGTTVRGLVKGGDVVSTGTNVGRSIGYNSSATLSSLAMSTVKVNGAIVTSSLSGISGYSIANLAAINDVNFADFALDTYIAGDEDNNGYYWDLSTGLLIQKSTTAYPLTFSLSGAGTTVSPYLVSSAADLKQAALKVGSVYKLTANIDMTGQSFYMLGTYVNRFTGTFNGDNKTLSNLSLTMNGPYVGFTGYNDGNITVMNFSNATVNGGTYTGIVAGYNSNNVNEITVSGNVVGGNATGLAVGQSYNGKTNSIIASGNVTGADYVGGIVGYTMAGRCSGVMTAGTVLATGTNYGRVYGYVYSVSDATGFAINTVTINGALASTILNPTNKSGTGIDSMSELNNVNVADLVLDTYIAGDENNNGYYWDLDTGGTLVYRTTASYPLTFSLSGAGTTVSPYLITSATDLKQATLKLSSTYKLMANIDMTGQSFYMLGTYVNPFTGTFNGNNASYSISNLLLNAPKGYYVGLVGYNKGTVNYVTLTNATVTGGHYTGALVGRNENKLITNTVSGTVTGSDFTGLALGYNYNTTVKGIMATGTVNGVSRVGGISGYSYNAISNCKFDGNVTGSGSYVSLGVGYVDYNVPIQFVVSGNVTGATHVGGVLGYGMGASSQVKSVFTSGSVNATSSYNRIIGASYFNMTTNLSYAASNITVNGSTVTSASTGSYQGSSATTTDLQNTIIYTNAGFNFTDEVLDYVWYFDGGIIKFREGNL